MPHFQTGALCVFRHERARGVALREKGQDRARHVRCIDGVSTGAFHRVEFVSQLRHIGSPPESNYGT